jgi:hypothetical protein
MQGGGRVWGHPLIHKVVSLISAETSLNVGTISFDFLAGIILDMLWGLFNF